MAGRRCLPLRRHHRRRMGAAGTLLLLLRVAGMESSGMWCWRYHLNTCLSQT